MCYKVQRTFYPNCSFMDLRQTRILRSFSTPGGAIANMWRLAFIDARHRLFEGTEVTITQTSDTRYSELWGFANYGIQIKAGIVLIQYEVIEVN